ncbi:uncharacterized protein LOC9659156 [Selaginella moellendorffii]|uniref:uncharacterized protein LOC9659156 n=1 Tax=Selaginella moellendorffii TaxID=88036 RepID=UPI000D1C2E60|nr:uncharacterized protein LOC9659156 [Selaginella moellendorffii]|eukprot:XP_024520367.1 uncharacterized protein LOC9659156 [Selaginella moellendorffii]
MGLLPVLVYYASVSRSGGRALAEYKNRSSSRDLAPVVVECLEQMPPLHSRFTLTIKRRIFSCLMEGAFTYCCIVDEALGKSDAFAFLEAMRDEFVAFLDSRGLRSDGEGLESFASAINKEFGATIKVLTLPLIGVPQKEIDSLRAQASPRGSSVPPAAPSVPYRADEGAAMTDPLYSGSERSDGGPEMGRSGSRAVRSSRHKRMNGNLHQQQQQEPIQVQHLLANGIGGDEEDGGDDRGGRIEVVVDQPGNSSFNVTAPAGNARNNEAGDLYPHSKSFSIREAENKWWRTVKLVLLVDVAINEHSGEKEQKQKRVLPVKGAMTTNLFVKLVINSVDGANG